MVYTKEERCRMWLSYAEISIRKIEALLQVYGGAQTVWEAFGSDMEKPLGSCAYATLQKMHTEGAMEGTLRQMEVLHIRALFSDSEEYPPLLKSIPVPPPVLYARGDPEILWGKTIAVVGTRAPSRYGRDMAREIARDLARSGVTVVSGFARGIDGAAHEGCLDGGGKTAAVMGCGLDIVYPPEHGELQKRILDAGGVFLSEYPLGTGPLSYHFPDRNRILSGMSQGMVFVEGRIKSGGMITVGHALDQGREVFAVPGPINREGAEGPHKLLREGARLITCAADILEDMGWSAEDAGTHCTMPKTSGLSAEERAVVALLQKEDLLFEELAQSLSLPAAQLNSLLTILELTGIIKKSPGNLYSLS